MFTFYIIEKFAEIKGFCGTSMIMMESKLPSAVAYCMVCTSSLVLNAVYG
jgi:hypothetical protein